MYQKLKGFHSVKQAQFQPHIALSLVVQNQTAPQRTLVITITAVDFQICHRKLSKKSGSTGKSSILCVPFCFLCTWKSTGHRPYIQYYVLIHTSSLCCRAKLIHGIMTCSDSLSAHINHSQ